ncbi:WD40 repeat-like protein [Jackrogersella minutella]|nr:WD40 repeat-like protein [Jackrogersella minutella]
MSDTPLNSDLLSPPRNTNGKERRNPSITPRKFKRFFTPRSRVPSRISPARMALQDLAVPGVSNRLQTQTRTPAHSSPLAPVSEEHTRDENRQSGTRRSKRRKIQHTPDSSSHRLPAAEPNHGVFSPSPSIRSALRSPIRSLQSIQENLDSDEDESEDELPHRPKPLKRLVPLTSRGFSGQLAQRGLGGMPRPGRSFMAIPASDWRIETANFHSKPPSDIYSMNSLDVVGAQCIPFCATACHRGNLTAIGDEEGQIRFLDSSNSTSFERLHERYYAHTNAIIDLDFSHDDLYLATASGDQSGRVLDMTTQRTTRILQKHTASLKQVRFQPGSANGKVLATSSRDGSIQIWDLRCYSSEEHDRSTRLSDPRDSHLTYRYQSQEYGCAVNSLYRAHVPTSRQARQAATDGQGDLPSRREQASRASDVSVTALQFLPAGQEHLLLSACEADATIKLWDIRSIHSSKQKVPTPLSVVAPPSSHENWRPFGISSLALNTDGTRLYAACKDNTVYAYSMAHLILGHAPELIATRKNEDPPRRRHNTVAHQGLGPLYGFRHPLFHAASFYVKCAVRPARDGKSELLAVGSSDSNAVLFPTQERYFKDDLVSAVGSLSLENSTIATAANTPVNIDGVRRALFRSNSTATVHRLHDDIPIVRKGTPLIRGHDSEVGAVAWTSEGKLVTVGDDFRVRLWSEDREAAADLRTGGETSGRRWNCGWADVGDDYDVSDDEE